MKKIILYLVAIASFSLLLVSFIWIYRNFPSTKPLFLIFSLLLISIVIYYKHPNGSSSFLKKFDIKNRHDILDKLKKRYK